MDVLPVQYRVQTNSWMSSELFKAWLLKTFVSEVLCHLHNQKLPEKAVLLLDNAPCHPEEDILQSPCGKVTGIFLPPNTSALIQPMDQGIPYVGKYWRDKILANERDLTFW